MPNTPETNQEPDSAASEVECKDLLDAIPKHPPRPDYYDLPDVTKYSKREAQKALLEAHKKIILLRDGFTRERASQERCYKVLEKSLKMIADEFNIIIS